MIKNIIKKILKEATSESGSRGSFVAPLKLGKRIFKKTELGPYQDSVSKYYSQELATDSYDGNMSTPKKEIKKIESKAKKSSTYTKYTPTQNDYNGEVINSYPKGKSKKVNEATFGYGGEYNAPLEIGMKKWKTPELQPFSDFVDTEANRIKIKSTTKNNIRRIVGMWEKGTDGSYKLDKHYVHTINEWDYEEAPMLTEDLAVWFGTKKKPKGSSQPKGPWVNICRKVDGKHPPCGRSEADTKSYPKCRAAGVAGKMSDSEKKSACAQKRRAEKKDPKIGTGNKPTMTSYKPKK